MQELDNNITLLLTSFRFNKQKLVKYLKKYEYSLSSDIDITCNPTCMDDTGKLISLCGMFKEKLAQLMSGKEYADFLACLTATKDVFIMLNALTPEELFIIKTKYLDGREEYDKNIYSLDEFFYGKTKYFELKNSAVRKIIDFLG